MPKSVCNEVAIARVRKKVSLNIEIFETTQNHPVQIFCFLLAWMRSNSRSASGLKGHVSVAATVTPDEDRIRKCCVLRLWNQRRNERELSIYVQATRRAQKH